jgi:very-short-patch-repair endonuclease
VVEITCRRGGRVRRPGIRAHRGTVAEDERTTIDDIPTTSPFRTLLDLATQLRDRQLERDWNEMQVRRLTDRMPLDELLSRHRGRRGTAALRELIRSTDLEGVTRSEFEERFVLFLDAHGLPRPRLNASLPLRSRFIEVDCLWERERLAVELDGYQVHGTPRAFQLDRKRDRELLAEGWRSTRVTWRQLQGEPEAVAADLRLALEAPSRHAHPPGK